MECLQENQSGLNVKKDELTNGAQKDRPSPTKRCRRRSRRRRPKRSSTPSQYVGERPEGSSGRNSRRQRRRHPHRSNEKFRDNQDLEHVRGRSRSKSFERSRSRDRETSRQKIKKDTDSSRHRRRRRRSDRSSSRSDSSRRHQGRGVVSDDEDATRGTDKKSTVRSPSVHDDTVGHFRGGKGSILADRYPILRDVGIGTFGRVVECLDLKARSPGRSQHYRDRDGLVAIKIVRDVKRYYESAVVEARIIKDVNRRGGRGLSHCVILHQSFTFARHFCMVFENLGPSLFDFMKRHEYRPFPMACIQDFAVQLLETLEFLHSFRCIHTDLKIENVLLMNAKEVMYQNRLVPESTRIKVIDFGGACYDDEKKSAVINTRQYRAPEVILGIGWSMPSDMWSLACLLGELYSGNLVFPTHDDVEHLALVERLISPFPSWMLHQARNSSQLARQAFASDDRHRLEGVLSAESASYVRKSPTLEGIVRPREDSWFLDLLRRMLVIDPHERATAHECLQFLSRIRRDVVRYT